MKSSDPILFRELPIIRKIIDDETWLESERRGCRVSSDDRVVREKVCEIVLRIGQELRDSLTAAIAQSTVNGHATGANEGVSNASKTRVSVAA
jgi:hypothetical protein